jgi:hypothetical protein
MKPTPVLANITAATTITDQDRIVALEARNTIIEAELARVHEYLTAIEPALIAIAKHVDDAPPPRFEVPKGWLTVKQASGVCGNAPPTIYRWVRRGRIVGMPHGGNIYVDPSTLPAKKILGVSKMIKLLFDLSRFSALSLTIEN